MLSYEKAEIFDEYFGFFLPVPLDCSEESY